MINQRMKFRLNYHVSEKTILEPGVILQNIQLHLNYKKYDIISAADNIVKFKTNPWELRWRHSPTKLDGGEFELNTSNDCTTITLNYYDNILLTLLLVVGMMISLISEGDYEPIPFFIAFFLITGLIHIITLKSKARELLKNILKDMNHDI
ncbi:MAG: hypothetical protein JWQ54_4090 [Mucilaginibacter sp.]|nr:hypothetical protein [Mucilaginibacter sp.]